MANLLASITGVTPFDRGQLVTDTRFNTLVSEMGKKIEDNTSAIGQKLDKSGGVVEGNLNVKSLGIGDSYKQKKLCLNQHYWFENGCTRYGDNLGIWSFKTYLYDKQPRIFCGENSQRNIYLR